MGAKSDGDMPSLCIGAEKPDLMREEKLFHLVRNKPENRPSVG